MLVVKDRYVLAERLNRSGRTASEGLTDDGDLRRTRVVLPMKRGPAERNFIRRKIVLTHHLPHGFVHRGSVFDLAGNKMSVIPLSFAMSAPRATSPAHAGQVIQPRQELLIELQQPFVLYPLCFRLQGEDRRFS